jgi:hypothetical protein
MPIEESKKKKREERAESHMEGKPKKQAAPWCQFNSQKSEVRSKKETPKEKLHGFTDKKKQPSTGIDMNYLNPIVVNLRGVVRSLLHSQLKTNG